MAESNGNGSTQKLVWWMVGLIGTLLTLGFGFLLSTLHGRFQELDRLASANAVTISQLVTRMETTDKYLSIVRENLLTNAKHLSELSAKTGVFETRFEAIHDQYRAILERLAEVQAAVQVRERPPPH